MGVSPNLLVVDQEQQLPVQPVSPPHSPRNKTGAAFKSWKDATTFIRVASENPNWSYYLFLGIFLLVLVLLIITLLITRVRRP